MRLHDLPAYAICLDRKPPSGAAVESWLKVFPHIRRGVAVDGKALDIMLTRVEVKVQSDRTRVSDGVEVKLNVLRTIAFRCQTWKSGQQMVGKRDFTAAEARGWVGYTKEPKMRCHEYSPSRITSFMFFVIFWKIVKNMFVETLQS